MFTIAVTRRSESGYSSGYNAPRFQCEYKEIIARDRNNVGFGGFR